MGSVPLNTALKPTVVGGFALDDFVVETSARNVTCLAGHTALVAPGGRHQQRRVILTARRAACPLHDRCTIAKTGR
ncbi:hypothetical protein [Nonomuraea fuscirosea]|uniref:hypothetical protein n=1 Tax=Nonomuraea fuscirosea TaxID=1291556 RepID=UPI0033EC879F